MGGIKGRTILQEYVYDYSVDGGTNGTAIDLHAKAGRAVLPVGAVIKSVIAKVETACTSGGAATVEWGNGSDTDGYSGTAIAVASLTANAIFNGWDNGAALIFDDTNDHIINPYVSSAATGQFKLLINVADLTAGKIIFNVEYFIPGIES